MEFDPVDRSALREILTTISVERNSITNPREIRRAFDFVAQRFRELGLHVEADPFLVGRQRFHNLLGILPSHETAPWVVVAAHLDAVPGTPGADDNASGVAALLECARLCSQRERRLNICLAATDLEEYGMQGARHLACRLRGEGVAVHAMISLEMLGYTDPEPGSQRYPPFLRRFYPTEANFIALVGNFRSRRLLKTVARSFRKVDGLPVETLAVPFNGWALPATRLSDHSPFWDMGMPALMVTDTAFFRNPHYHQSTDTVDTLDIDFLARVTEGLVRSVAGLAAVRAPSECAVELPLSVSAS